MNQAEVTQNTISLIRSFLTGEAFDGELSEGLRNEVYVLAAKHDMAHLIAVVLERSAPLKNNDPFWGAKRQAMYRYLTQDMEREKIYGLFEQAELPFIPLKGSVICSFYPEPWQRVGCDIDILVHEENLDQAVDLLQKEFSYALGQKSEHDISLMSPGGVHLELHYDLHEAEVSVEQVWEDARPIRDGSCRFVLSGETFLFHHIAHMAKHCRIGGCGLRPFVDLWLLRKHVVYDAAKLEQHLESKGLKKFSDTVYDLLDFWFGNGTATPLAQKMAGYIVPAGAYGSMKNLVAIGQLKKGSRRDYFRSRLFQPREALEYPYPILKQHGWLLPVCQAHRWIKLLSDGKANKIMFELKTNAAMDQNYKNDVATLLNQLDLQRSD